MFSPRKGHFLFIFECLPLFLFSFFWPPPFWIFLSLSLSSSCPFFLPSCLSFLLYFASLFLSLSFLCFILCFCFMKRTTSNYSITKFSFINIFPFFGFLSSFLFEIPFLIFVFFFFDFKLCFCSTSLFLVSKKPKLKNTNFWSKGGGCNKTVFFMNLCFAKCEKLSFWGAPCFWQILVDVQKTL